MSIFFPSAEELAARHAAAAQHAAEEQARRQSAGSQIVTLHGPGALFHICTKTRSGGFFPKPFINGAPFEAPAYNDDGTPADDLGLHRVGGVEEAIDYAFAQCARGKDVYVTVASFRRSRPYRVYVDEKTGQRRVIGDRRGSNFMLSRALVGDADMKDESHPDGHDSHDEVEAELLRFCRETDLPLPLFMVNSGSGGAHIYWLTTTALNIDDWAPHAFALTALAAKAGFRHDPQCTIDAVRVLRLIGTSNWKTGAPRPVTLTRTLGSPVEPDTLRAVFERAGVFDSEVRIGSSWTRSGNGAGGGRKGVFGMPMGAPGGAGGVVAGAEAAAAKVAGGYWRGADHKLLFQRCGQLQHSRASKGAGETEPIWRAVMSILARCNDPLAAAQETYGGEGGRRDFNFSGTVAKMDRTEAPYSCAKFNALRPGLCPGCPAFGRRVNPLRLDTEAKWVPPAAEQAAYEQARRVFQVRSQQHDVRVGLGAVLMFLDTLEEPLRAPVASRVALFAAFSSDEGRPVYENDLVAFLDGWGAEGRIEAQRVFRVAAERQAAEARIYAGEIGTGGSAENSAGSSTGGRT